VLSRSGGIAGLAAVLFSSRAEQESGRV